MVERLTKGDLEQAFKGFEKRQDDKMKAFEKRLVDQFNVDRAIDQFGSRESMTSL